MGKLDRVIQSREGVSEYRIRPSRYHSDLYNLESFAELQATSEQDLVEKMLSQYEPEERLNVLATIRRLLESSDSQN